MNSSFFGSSFGKKSPSISRRRLQIESLENREMLSATLADLPEPNFEPSETVLTATMFAATAQSETTAQLAPPEKPSGSRYAATPSTLTVSWGDPKVKNGNTDEITYFQIIVRDAKTKKEVISPIKTSDASVRSITVNGLDPNTRYEIAVISCGGQGTLSSKAYSVTCTTQKFQVASGLSQVTTNNSKTMSGVVVSFKDTDKTFPVANGKTVKTYTVVFAEGNGKNADWSHAQSIVITPGANVVNGAISVAVSGLKPNATYSFKVLSEYKEGSTTLTGESNIRSGVRTAAAPKTKISSMSYTLSNNDLALNVNGNIAASGLKTLGNAAISYQLQISLSSAKEKTTGALSEGVRVDLASFGAHDSKGNFTLTSPIAFETLASLLGVSNILNARSVYFQIITVYDLTESGQAEKNIASVYSSPSALAMPSWYNAA